MKCQENRYLIGIRPEGEKHADDLQLLASPDLPVKTAFLSEQL
jgi:hypothetical protein